MTTLASVRCSTGLVPGQRLAWRSGRHHALTVSERRRVVVTDDVLYAVDAALPQAPTAGRPSRAQFISTDLLEAVEQFAVGWDDLASLIPGRDDYRVLISRGTSSWSKGSWLTTAPSSSSVSNSTSPSLRSEASRKGMGMRAAPDTWSEHW